MTTQLNNFLALENNFSHALEANEVALNSAGSAAQENSRYMQSLAAKTSAVKASFEQLSAAVVDSNLVKSLLDMAKALFDLANTPFGTFVTQASLLTGVLWGGTGLIKAMKIIPNLLGKGAAAVTLFGKAVSISVPHLALIATAIAALLHFGPKLVDWFKKQTDPAYEAGEAIKKYNEQLTENEERLEELNKIPYKNRTDEINDEIEALENENKTLRDNIALKKGESSKAEAVKALSSEKEMSGYSYSLLGGTPKFVSSGKQVLQELVDLGIFAQEEIDELLKQVNGDIPAALDKLGIKLQETTKKVSSREFYTDAFFDLEKLIEQFQKGDSIDANFIGAFEEANGALQEFLDMTSEYSNKDLEDMGMVWVVQLREHLSDLPDITDKVADSYYNAVESLLALSKGMAINELQYKQVLKLYPELEGHLTKTELGYEDLEGVTANYGKENEYLADSLMGLSTPVHQLLSGLGVTKEQIEDLIGLYPQLTEVVQQNAGAYYLDIQALADSADAGSEWARSFISSQSAATEETLKQVKTRITALQYELAAARAAGRDKLYKNMLTQQLAELEEQRDALNRLNAYADYSGIGGSITTGSGGGGSSTEKETDPIAEQNKLFKEQVAILEHKLLLMQKAGASEEEQIAHLRQMQDLVHEQAEWMREHGVDEDSEYIRDLQKEWWDYQEQIEGLYKSQAEVYEMLFSAVADKAQEEIDALEKKKQAIQEQNEALEEQMKLQKALDNLARAKQQQKLVLKNGRLQYVQDEDAVSEAQAEVEKIRNEQRLDEEIEQIDKEIQVWQDYKDEWSSVVNDYQKQQDLLLIEQKLGIKLEGENWEKRLGNLQKYVNEYNRLMAQAGENVGDKSSGSNSANHYASGTTRARGGISMVGEKGPEMRIINQGDGILPASITKNLWSWGTTTPYDMMSNIVGASRNAMQSVGIRIENFNPVLPNVTDGESFATYLKNNFWRDAMQLGMA